MIKFEIICEQLVIFMFTVHIMDKTVFNISTLSGMGEYGNLDSCFGN